MIIDTSVLSGIVSKNPDVRLGLMAYLTLDDVKTSSIVIYEIEFGLIRKNALGALERFRKYCANIEVISVNTEIAQLAAKTKAEQEAKGKTFHTEDLLIGATAKFLNEEIVTFNVKDFAHWGLRVSQPRTSSEIAANADKILEESKKRT